jgi:type II secretory pathway pseudopilin PulG
MQAKRGLQHSLRREPSSRQQEHRGSHGPSSEASAHGGTFAGFRLIRKARSLRRGMMLLESMLALSILTVIGLVLLKLSLNILHPRQWTLQQTLTDAYLTYERSYAERITFEDLLANGSPWPVFPTTSTTSVEIGRLPGGAPVNGTLMRTRIADTANYPIDGGDPTKTQAEVLAINPAAMKIWKVQSVVTYTIGNRTYAKSRTVLRSQ